MPKFDAARVITSLDYDFTRFGGPKGTVPEPSDPQIFAYSKAMSELGEELGINERDPKKIAAVAASLTETDMMEHAVRQAEITAALCGNHPSAEELMNVPPRVRAAFYGWLSEMLNPEV